MRLLIVTQTVDTKDPVLGFFHTWISELAKTFERVEVVCLTEGKHELPANVRIHSLGKERGAASRATYGLRFLALAWKLRSGYDLVFVHMNQEYILIAGWLWKLLGKRIYLWRNHYAGSPLTDIAAAFCANIFCTSTHSYTARYKKTIIMPVGVDAERFLHADAVTRAPRSILFFSRIAPSKRPDLFIEALGLLKAKGVEFSASVAGSPLPEDEAFYESLKRRARELGLNASLSFHAGVPHTEAPALFAAHEIFVNASPSGMLDKTIFEAAASGCLVLAASEDFKMYAGEELYFSDAGTLAERLAVLLPASEGYREKLRALADRNSLSRLISRLSEILTK